MSRTRIPKPDFEEFRRALAYPAARIKLCIELDQSEAVVLLGSDELARAWHENWTPRKPRPIKVVDLRHFRRGTHGRRGFRSLFSSAMAVPVVIATVIVLAFAAFMVWHVVTTQQRPGQISTSELNKATDWILNGFHSPSPDLTAKPSP
jgi:hypothetical protein